MRNMAEEEACCWNEPTAIVIPHHNLVWKCKVARHTQHSGPSPVPLHAAARGIPSRVKGIPTLIKAVLACALQLTMEPHLLPLLLRHKQRFVQLFITTSIISVIIVSSTIIVIIIIVIINVIVIIISHLASKGCFCLITA